MNPGLALRFRPELVPLGAATDDHQLECRHQLSHPPGSLDQIAYLFDRINRPNVDGMRPGAEADLLP